jgi:transcriptional regulator with XRE-family HTH domain
MPLLKEILPRIRMKHGTQVDVAEKLGIKSQLLGQYEKGKRNPKLAFYQKWKAVFGEDLQALTEANVSFETKKGTYVETPSNKKEMENPEEVYRTIVEGNTEYVLIPRKVLDRTQLVSADELDRKNNQIDFYQKQIGRLLETLELQPKSPDPKEVKQ